MKISIIAIFTHLLTNVFCETSSNNFTTTYDPAELLRKIFNTNDTILPRANYGLIQFEGQIPQPDFVNFDAHHNLDDNRENIYTHESSVKFENEYDPTYSTNIQNVVKFEDTTKNSSKRKKRRKRKPKQHYGLQNPGNIPGNLPYSPGYGNDPGLYPSPSYGGQYYRPPRLRPRPSLASEALSAVTAALTSIALYDDYQCVPRLLCEAAAGGALGSSGILQTVSGLQPLLTLLSAYSGVASNPLFVFGRAALLGASSRGNPATCRYAYTHCPNDPEELVHYLNNHNGGFFRFFNAPQHGQQNVEQFYDQLSQNFGLYQPNQEYNQPNSQQNYGFHNNQQNYNSHNPNLYSNYNQNYGLAYPYQNNNQNVRFKNNDNNYSENTNRIEKRIQNIPNSPYIDESEDENPRWTFPEGNRNPVHYINNDAFNLYSPDNNNFDNNDKRINQNDQNDRYRYYKDNRKGKILKFPGVNNEEDYLEANYDSNRGSFFPENQENKPYSDYNAPTKNNYDNNYDNRQQYLDYNTPTKINYDKKFYENQQKYSNYNTPTKNNYYDNQQHGFNYDTPTNNKYDNKYYDNNQQQYFNYNTPTRNSNAYNRQYSDYNSASNNNRFNSGYNTPANYNFDDNKYVNSDEFYADRFYANKNKYNNDNYANKDKYYNNDDYYANKNDYNYNNDLQKGIRTVYVVRGNGDPNKPEIHKLRPGQTVP